MTFTFCYLYSLMSLLKKYWGTLRRMKMLHVLHNLSNYGKLKRNRPLYQKYGVHKSVISPISHKDFTQHTGELPWLDVPGGLERAMADPRFEKLSPAFREQVKQWPENGYMILEGFVSPENCDRISADLERMIAQKEVDFDYTESRVMNAWKHSGTIRSVISDPKLTELLGFTLNRPVVPFQTISFLKGSQQKTHSDFIHMTTEPVGYLCAIWVALEDLTEDCGPLHYYPGSHRLPYILGEDFEHSSTTAFVGDDLYGNYEKAIAREVEEKQLKKKIFLAKKGDLLVWHANLLHGGEKVTREGASRKSLVAHYFCKGDIVCYHEITQRPAVLPD